jgi:hypothetical protein
VFVGAEYGDQGNSLLFNGSLGREEALSLGAGCRRQKQKERVVGWGGGWAGEGREEERRGRDSAKE